MDIKTIGEFLKSLRKAKGLTQEEVANILYLSPKTISRWESGNGIPDINIISTVADLYDVTVDEILKGKRNLISNEEISKKTIQLHNKSKEKVICNNLLSKLNLYLIISLSILGFFLLLEIIFGFIVSEIVSIILMPIGLFISIIIMIIGNSEIKRLLNDEEEFINIEKINFEIRKKNLLYIDVLVTILVILIIFIIIFFCS